jgi:alpha-D-xyloside xylohydrolase
MKFRDGYWHTKPGVTLKSPKELKDYERRGKELLTYSATGKINHRGDTLNKSLITTSYSSPMKDVIHVHSYHFNGGLESGPDFEVLEDKENGIVVNEDENSIMISSGEISAVISRSQEYSIKYMYKGKSLTEVSPRLSGHIQLDDGRTFMSENLKLSVGELVYGLGERFTSFVKNGQVVDIWNEDGGTSSEQAYKNIPFYITNKGYGIFVADPGKVSFEVASEVVTSVQFSVPGEILDYYIIAGTDQKDIISKYTLLTGRPSLPPQWSFGLWLTTSFTTDYNEKTVTNFIDGMAERKIPLHVFHFDCFWMKEFQWVDFQWDKDQFPDPVGMLSRLKKKGLNICIWINPYIAQKSCLFDIGKENGYLVKNTDGSVWQWDRWQAGMGLVDFTNPEAVKWYQNELKILMEQGVDTFKTDFGERIPVSVKYFDGSDPDKMHNYYTYLYNKAVFEVVEEFKGKYQALLFARSATAGGQKFPVHWGGDCSATYESMAESLRAGLSLAQSGFGFWSHDISGFELTATPDLFKRWIAFGAFSTHSRLHGNESYRVPWNFDEESSDVLRFFINLKCSLMPYLFSQACQTVLTGIPVMRPMVMEFNSERACEYLDQQYMFGDSLLIAPLFNDKGSINYFLPEGRWTNFLNGEVINGGRWIKETHDYKSLPVMVRQGSLIPVGNNNQVPDYDYADGVIFHMFEMEEDSTSSASIYDENAVKVMEVTISRNSDLYKIKKEGSGDNWKVLMRGFDQNCTVSCGSSEVVDQGLLVKPDSGTSQCSVKVDRK